MLLLLRAVIPRIGVRRRRLMGLRRPVRRMPTLPLPLLLPSVMRMPLPAAVSLCGVRVMAVPRRTRGCPVLLRMVSRILSRGGGGLVVMCGMMSVRRRRRRVGMGAMVCSSGGGRAVRIVVGMVLLLMMRIACERERIRNEK